MNRVKKKIIITKRIKPAVAFSTEQVARVNLVSKLEMLKNTIASLERDELGIEDLDIPRSMRQFNLWKVQNNNGSQLNANSRETLNKHVDIKDSVEQAISSLRKMQHAFAKKPDREQTLAAARRNGALNKILREIAERELLKIRTFNLSLKRELEIAQAMLTSFVEKSNSDASKLEYEISELRVENARLIKALAKVVPLRTR